MAGEMKFKDISRRDFIKTAGAFALGAGMGANLLFSGNARADQKKLKIQQWTHTDSEFRGWFSEFCEQWGRKNDTEVDVDRGPM